MNAKAVKPSGADVEKPESPAEEGQSTPDVRAIMAEIRTRIKSDSAQNRDRLPAFTPSAPGGASASRRAGELLQSEELRYLNANHHFARLNLDGISSHRPGLIGRCIVKAKRKLMQLIWDSLLKDYFTAERDYQAQLVRFLNDVSKYVDARDAANFWELIRKVDVDVTRAIERIETIADDQNATLRSTERGLRESFDDSLRKLSALLGALQSESVKHGDELRILDSVARGLEGVVSRLEVPGARSLPAADSTAAQGEPARYSYLLLENRFRGSESEIAERLRPYVEIFQGAKESVLELGGGRGELQRLFSQAGIRSYSVDPDAAMVEAARSHGCDARLGEGIAHLQSVPDRSLGGIIAIQVVEHLSRAQIEELCALCAAKLAPGAPVVFETINPQSLLALSSNYFRDPTHVFPQHPDTLKFQLESAGIRGVEVRYLSPVPAQAALRPIEASEHMPPRWAYAVELINHNFEALNRLLYGHQDYCVVGRAGA